MKKEQILDFINKNPICALATADENQPHVRYITMYRADEEGLVFSTGENKDLNNQLRRNPMVEMCFYSSEEQKQIRVSGTVEEYEDIQLKKKIIEEYPFLQEWVDREGYDVLVVYILKNGKATVWTMETTFALKEYIDL